VEKHLQHDGWKCTRCGTTTRRGNWRRENERAVFYCQPCVTALGGPAYDPTTPIPPGARRSLVLARRQAKRQIRFPRWMSKKSPRSNQSQKEKQP
jgi:ribosomal protein L37AE/L43A